MNTTTDFYLDELSNKLTPTALEKIKKRIKKGDIVIFRNIFAYLAGRVSNLVIENNVIVRCHIQAVDSTFSISTYNVHINDVLLILNK